MTTTFDPAVYKETTRVQWEDAAEAWHRWGPFLEEWLGEATELMLDLAEVREGSRVVDIAAGAGGQTIAAARRVGDGGSVLATDISAAILDFAASEARGTGLGNVATLTLDGEALDVDAGAFDAAISRLGLMYMPDKAHALAEASRALRPGGRYAAIVFSEPERNGFFSGPIGIIRRRAQLPPPAPGLPGPFSSARPASSSRRPASRTSTCGAWRLPCGWRAPPNARGSSASRSGRSTRCSPAFPSPSARRRGPRSRRR